MKKDEFGDRIKTYESIQTKNILIPQLPIIARIDGRCFHTWTKDFDRPFDSRLSSIMMKVMKDVVSEFNCNCGYTQSDEITLTWWSNNYLSQPLFGGKIFKLCSVIASYITSRFCVYLHDNSLPYVNYPTFDCRVFNVPSKTEGANVFLWRHNDAYKNSVSAAARFYYSHKELEGKNTEDRKQMLLLKNVDWNCYPVYFKYGCFARKSTIDDINSIAELTSFNHSFSKIINREEFIYDNLTPIRIENEPVVNRL